MARSLRNNEPGTWHHLMNQGVDRNDVFLCDADRLTFERLLGQITFEHGITIAAYCLMGNHYHAVGRAGQEGISAAMQQLSSSYTRIVNDRTGRVGPLFRGRFTSVTIESDEQLMATVAYVHRNPVDLVPVAALAAYRWSSYGAYLGSRPAAPWLDTSMVTHVMGPSQHRLLVEHGLDVDRDDDRDELFEVVSSFVPRRSDLRRTVALVAAAEIGCGTSDIVSWFGFSSAGAARTALSRARRTSARSAEVCGVVDQVVTLLAARRHVTPGV